MDKEILKKRRLTKPEMKQLVKETEWLDNQLNIVPIFVRKYCIAYDILSINEFPKCPICNKPLLSDTNVKDMIKNAKLPIYCSNECRRSKSGESLRTQKLKQSVLEKYGVENVFQLDSVKEKAIETNLKTLGVAHASQSEKIKKKVEQTTLDRYGVTHASKLDRFKNKMKQTMLDRHGVEYAQQSESIREKSKKTYQEHYGVDHHFQSEEIKNNIKKVNLDKYGFESHNQSELVKKKKEETNLKAHGVKNPMQCKEINNKAVKTGKSNYYELFMNLQKRRGFIFLGKEEDYLNSKPLKFKCTRCKDEFLTNNTRVKGVYCPNPIHKTTSKPEYEIGDFVKSLDLEIIRNKRYYYYKSKYHEIDILIDDMNIGIEYHGLHTHNDLNKQRIHHQNKYKFFNEKGIRVIQIFANEWNNKKDIVKSIIKSSLGLLNKTIYARKCEIKVLDQSLYREFLIKNHVQGHVGSSIKLGLFYEDELVSVQSFSLRRYKNEKEDNVYEMMRFCNKLDHNIVGGFSKLLKYFIKNYNPIKIDSFIDLRYFNGSGYLKNGFKNIHITKPNYYYFKDNDYSESRLYSRLKFQKHKLMNELDIFDENLSEYQNMLNNGYLRIFDAGNLLVSFDLEKS